MEIDVKKLPVNYKKKPNGKIGVWLIYIHFADIIESAGTFFVLFLNTRVTIECKTKIEVDKMIRDEVGQYLKDVLTNASKTQG